MKLLITIGLTFVLLSFTSLSNGLDRLEIWGWNGEKEAFRDLYLEKTGVDLAKSYACAVELSKMGYKNALSMIYPDDIQAYLAGKINWETTDRLVIIREFPATRFTDMLQDAILQSTIEQLLDNIKNDLTLLNEPSENEEFTNFELLLIGTITPFNTSLRDNCNAMIRDIESENIVFRDTTAEILAAMLSIPDPVTCYNAMTQIGNFKDSQYPIDQITIYKALTLKEFLASDIQSFQSDTVDFLTSLYPGRDDWTVNEWKEWIKLFE